MSEVGFLHIKTDISNGWRSGGPVLHHFTTEINTPYMKTSTRYVRMPISSTPFTGTLMISDKAYNVVGSS